MKQMPEHLEHLKNNLYINANDILYSEKKLRYLGNDFESLMEMARKKWMQGKLAEADSLYARAQKAANSAAQMGQAYLWRRRLQQAMAEPDTSAQAEQPTRRRAWMLLVPLLLLLGFLLGLWSGWEWWTKEARAENIPLPGDTAGGPSLPVMGAGGDEAEREEKEQQLSMLLTYLRSGLLGYVRTVGHFPERLEDLARGFPHNFISGIPPEPWTGQRHVVTVRDNGGGWVYQPPPLSPQQIAQLSEEGLLLAVARALTPNLSAELWIEEPFIPLEIQVDLGQKRVSLTSGQQVWLMREAAVGTTSAPTPAGTFVVQKRVWLPQPHPEARGNPYGTAGLQFAGHYAIHGTERTEFLGMEATFGCIRLADADMALLYAWTPVGTPVHIAEQAELEREGEALLEWQLAGWLQPGWEEQDFEGRYTWRG